MPGADPSQPLLLQLLSAFNQGEKGSATGLSSANKPSMGFGGAKEEVKRVEPLSFQGLPEARSSGKKKAGVDSTDKHLDKANNLLADLEREEKDGFNLRESHDDDDFDMDMSDKKKSSKKGGLAQMNLNGGISKEEPSENNYDDDFDDDIEEDIPEDHHDPLADDADLNARSANIGGSG